MAQLLVESAGMAEGWWWYETEGKGLASWSGAVDTHEMLGSRVKLADALATDRLSPTLKKKSVRIGAYTFSHDSVFPFNIIDHERRPIDVR